MTHKDKRPGHWRITLAETVQDGVLVVAVAGRIGHASAASLHRSLEERIEGGARRVALDLEGVDYISSAGLQALDALARRLEAVDGRLTLCALTEPAWLVLKLAGWAERFDIQPTREQAVSRLV